MLPLGLPLGGAKLTDVISIIRRGAFYAVLMVLRAK